MTSFNSLAELGYSSLVQFITGSSLVNKSSRIVKTADYDSIKSFPVLLALEMYSE